MTTQNTAQAVVFLEALARIVEKSPVTYSVEAAAELASSIRSMTEEVTTDSRVDPEVLDATRQYATLDWHNEIAAVLFDRENRPKVH